MKVGTMTDSELVEAIKTGGSKRQRAIAVIYKDKSFSQQVIQFVQKNSGNLQDGQDIFHEGIIVLDRNIRNGKFQLESSLKAYLFSSCRFLWMNQIRKKRKIDLTEDVKIMDEVDDKNPETIFTNDEKKNILQQVVGQLSERCQKILELWKLSYSMEEIAEKMGFSSAAMARKNKYRCHKSLMDFLTKHPELAALLKM